MPGLREERFDRARIQRPGEEKALALVALLALELPELVVSSMPSARVSMLRVLPSWTSAWMIAAASLEVARLEMNERSILSASTGNWRR